MSLKLDHSTDANIKRLAAKTYQANKVYLWIEAQLGEPGLGRTGLTLEIDMRDFCVLVLYVLTNTDLDPMDPRVELVNKIKTMEIVEGHNGPDTGRFRVPR